MSFFKTIAAFGLAFSIATTGSAVAQSLPTKEKLIETLEQLVERLEKKDYSAAAELLVLPPNLEQGKIDKIFSNFIISKEISREGISLLAAAAPFGTVVEVCGEERAKALTQKANVDIESVYGFNFQGAEALAVWKDGQFKMIRFDDIGKLVARAKTAQELNAQTTGQLKTAVQENPEDAQLRAELAAALYEESDLANAWKHLRIANRLKPNNEDYIGGIATLLSDFEQAGVFSVGKSPQNFVRLLGEPDEKVDLGSGKSRWLYSFFGVDFQDEKIFSVIDLRAATEELFYPTEIVSLTLDQRSWTVGFRKKEDSLVTENWFLPGESTKQWTEQISIERILGIANEGTSEELANFMIEQMKAGTAGLQAHLLTHDEKSATVSFEIPIDEDGNSIHRLVRIIKGPKDLHRIGISLVKQPTETTQRKWFEILQNAKLTPTK